MAKVGGVNPFGQQPEFPDRSDHVSCGARTTSLSPRAVLGALGNFPSKVRSYAVMARRAADCKQSEELARRVPWLSKEPDEKQREEITAIMSRINDLPFDLRATPLTTVALYLYELAPGLRLNAFHGIIDAAVQAARDHAAFEGRMSARGITRAPLAPENWATLRSTLEYQLGRFPEAERESASEALKLLG